MKKVLKFFLILIGLLLIAMLVLPILFKDQIQTIVMREANKNLNAELTIGEIDLSLFRDFPNLSVKISDLNIANRAPFEGTDLVHAGSILMEIDLFSALSGNTFEVQKIGIEDSRIDIRILEDGTANYDIVPEGEPEVEESSDQPSESGYKLTLKEYYLENFNLVYDDREGEMFADIRELNHRGRGDFAMDIVDLSTLTEIGSLTFRMEDIDYLKEVTGKAEVNMTYEQATEKITLKENHIDLNDLVLEAEGWLVMMEDGVDMDLSFDAPKNRIKDLLSLIPTYYSQDFEGLEADGSFTLDGKVFGKYNYEGEDLPGFEIRSGIGNGKIRYPDLPTGIDQLDLGLRISHPDQTTADGVVIEINKMGANIGGGRLTADLLLKTPMSDPFVKLFADADLDLAKVQEALRLEDMELAGLLKAKVRVEGSVSDFEALRTERTVAEGEADLKDFVYRSSDLKEAIQIPSMGMKVDPEKLAIPELKMRIGNSDIEASGRLDNMVSYALKDTTLRGSFSLTSDMLDLNQLSTLMAGDSIPEDAGATTGDTAAMTAVVVPTNLDIRLSTKAKKIVYSDLDLNDLEGELLIRNGVITLKDVTTKTMGGEIGLSGSYKGVEGEAPHVEMRVDLTKLPFANAFSQLSMLNAYAPLLQQASGAFTAGFDLSTDLTGQMSPDLSSLSADGLLKTFNFGLKSESTEKLAATFNNPSLANVKLGNADLSFSIENGRLGIQPVNLTLGGYEGTLTGSSGLDKSLDYTLTTKLPISKISLPKELSALGITSGDVPIDIKVGGTFSSPTFKPVFGDVGGSVKEQVTQAIQQEIDKKKEELVNKANEEAQKLIDQAEAEGDKLVAEAKKQAANIRQEAKKQADNLRAEAKKQADKIVADAKGNPLKEAGAKILADKTIQEAEKQAQKIEAEANKRADQLVRSAEEQKQKLIEDARQKAKISQ